MERLIDMWVDERIAVGGEPREPKGEAARELDSGAVPSEDQFRILIIDDDIDMREALVDLLELKNYVVEEAADFDGAIERARSRPPNVALIDVKLGPSNGIDLIPILKGLNPGTVCIVLTAFRHEEHANKAHEAGADEFLFKPLDPELLWELIRQRTTGASSETDD